jgi:hypothetical protein
MIIMSFDFHAQTEGNKRKRKINCLLRHHLEKNCPDQIAAPSACSIPCKPVNATES